LLNATITLAGCKYLRDYAQPVNVEIWSDIACPWCYVGKHRFQRALEAFEHRDQVAVTWRAFELDPSAPPERPGDHAAHLAAKYGRTLEQVGQMHDEMTAMGAAEGLDLRFDRVRSGNTFDAHRVVHLAAFHGAQDAMQERLMRAYLTEGELMSDHAALARLAGEVGLPPTEVEELLAGDRFAAEVRAEQELAHGFGISAVPFFVIERTLGGAGAQPVEAFHELLTQAWERTRAQPA
jgi:predicted DsbA family dithiol-disulfide isomerase